MKVSPIDNRQQPIAPELRADREFTVSTNTFLVRKKAGSLTPTFIAAALDTGRAKLLTVGAHGEQKNLVVTVDSDLEADAERQLRSDPSVREVFPVLLTSKEEVRPARLNRVVVSLNSSTVRARALFAKDHDLELVDFDKAGNVGTYEILSGTYSDKFDALSKDSRIRYAEPDFLSDTSDFDALNARPTAAAMQADQMWNHKLLGLDDAHSVTRGAGVVVAVVDGRCNAKHESIKGGLVVGPDEFEFASGTEPYFKDHGTQVAGIVGGRVTPEPNIPLGVAPEAGLLCVSIVTNSDGSYTSRTKALNLLAKICQDGQWIDSGNRKIKIPRLICNCSWNVANPPPINVEEAFENLDRAGAIICCSAGNNGTEGAHYPSDFKFCVSVAAVGPSLAKAAYSNFSNSVAVSAPGGDDDPPGTDPARTSMIFSSSWDGYRLDTGTSFAAPHVSGVLALTWSAWPAATNRQVVQCMLDHGVVDISKQNPQYEGKLGRGLIRADLCVNAAKNSAISSSQASARLAKSSAT